MNLIARFITKKGELTNDIRKAQALAETERLKVMEDISYNVENNARLSENIRVINAKAKQIKDGTRKSTLYNSLALLFTIVSYFLSALGITGASTPTELFKDLRACIISLMLISVSFMLYIISTQANYLNKHFNIDFKRLEWLRRTAVLISVVGNYIFLESVLKPRNYFDYFVTMVFAIIPDYVTCVFGDMSQNVKYSNTSYEGETLSVNFFSMLAKMIKIKSIMILAKPYQKTLREYQEKCVPILGEKTPLKLDETKEKPRATLSENTTYTTDKIVCTAPKNLSEKKTVNVEIKQSKNTYENAVKKINGMTKDDIISKATLNLKCTDYEYRKIREKLKEKGLIYIDGKLSKKA